MGDSGITNSIEHYFDHYIENRPLEPYETPQLNRIGRVVKPQEIGKISTELKDNNIKIQNLKFENIYYFPWSPDTLIRTQKWAHDIGEETFGLEETHLNMMVKYSVLLWNNGKYWSNNLHNPSRVLSEKYINQVQEGLTKFCSIFSKSSRNQTGSTPIQKLPYHSRGYSGPTASSCHSNWHRRQKLGRKVQHDSATVLPWWIQWRGLWYYN